MQYAMLTDALGLLLIGISVIVWMVAVRLSRVDPKYFRTRDGALHWWDFSAYLKVIGMVVDHRLPDSKHDQKMRRGIYLARALYATGIGIGAFFWYFVMMHAHPVHSR